MRMARRGPPWRRGRWQAYGPRPGRDGRALRGRGQGYGPGSGHDGRDRWAVPRAVGWVGALAGMVGCGIPLVLGIGAGWSFPKVLGYAGLALLYLMLTQSFNLMQVFAPAVRRPRAMYFLISGLICLALQTISGDPYLQPIVFTAPLVGAALVYPARETIRVALYYLLLMGIGLQLSNPPFTAATLLPLVGYGTLMAVIFSFTRVLAGQSEARQRADRLAADLAEQRDYLARLVALTATLTRDLDLRSVLEQVAAAGQSLAQAEQARVWLGDPDGEAAPDTPGPMLLGAAVPAATDEARPEPPPAGLAITATSLILPLIFKDQTIGVLELQGREDRAFTVVDVGLLQPFADTAAVAIQNARLYEQAGLSATLAERNRLARELHDTIAQGLTAVTMHLEAAQRSFDRYPDRARARLVRASELSRQTLADVRRSVWTLAAPLGDGVALPPALDELVQNFAARTGLAATYTHSGPPPPLDAAATTQAVRIMQEALLNVEKHAQATIVTIHSETDDGAVRVSVQDNGQGFDPQAPPLDGSTGGGFGLFSLQERARLAGGRLQVQSAPGTGTQITLTIPRHAPGEAAE